MELITVSNKITGKQLYSDFLDPKTDMNQLFEEICAKVGHRDFKVFVSNDDVAVDIEKS